MAAAACLYSPARRPLKAKIALKALREQASVADLAQRDERRELIKELRDGMK